MTRQEQAEQIVQKVRRHQECETHEPIACDCTIAEEVEAVAISLAALEQQAIDAYLADVPLPEGWVEDMMVLGAAQGVYVDEDGYDRVWVYETGVSIVSTPAGWPPIPLPALIRAAVQCHRLREAGR